MAAAAVAVPAVPAEAEAAVAGAANHLHGHSGGTRISKHFSTSVSHIIYLGLARTMAL